MIKRILYFIIFSSLELILDISCCDSKLISEFNFTQNDLKINPYSGSETLIFNNLNGATKTFASGKRSSSTRTMYKDLNNDEEKKCKGDYFHSESNLTSFQSTDDSLLFEILLSYDPYLSNSTVKKVITFSSQNIHIAVASGDRTSYFDNDTIYNNGPSWSDSSYFYHKSITIGPKSFENVYQVHLVAQYLSIVTEVYYSKNDGIIGFNTQHEGLWYLDKIIK